MDTQQLMFVLLFILQWCGDCALGHESLLIRTKRKPFKEYDYIEESQRDMQDQSEANQQVRAQRNILEDFTDSLKTPAVDEGVFDHLVEKHKRFINENRNDPFLKLKAFFEELKKHSSDEDDSVHDNDEDDKTHDKLTTHSGLEHVLDILKNQNVSEDNSAVVGTSSSSLSTDEKRATEEGKSTLTKTSTAEKSQDKTKDNVGFPSKNLDGSGDESENESGSGQSGDTSGSGSGESEIEVNSKRKNKRSINEDFSALFLQTEESDEKIIQLKKHLNHHEKIERSKRELNDETSNPDFEGLPEKLAVIQRENPRAKILNMEAKGKHIPDIPLPFNHEEVKVENAEEDAHVKVDNHVIRKKIAETNKDFKSGSSMQKRLIIEETSIPYTELKSIEKVKHSLGEEKLKNLRIIDEKKAKSLFDVDEGDFLNHIKRDGVYYDARNNRYLISAKAEDVKKSNVWSRTISKKTTKKVTKNISEPVSKVHNRKLVEMSNVLKNNTNRERLPTKDSANGSIETFKSGKVDVNNSLKHSLSISRRSVDEYDQRKPKQNEIQSTNNTIAVNKRDVLADDDPNIDYLMRYDGKTDDIEDQKIALDNQKRQRLSIRAAEEVYKFARNVMDLVGETEKKKTKRHTESSSLAGVWSGLGTSPEFVPGLVKRDYNDNVHNMRELSTMNGRQTLTAKKKNHFNNHTDPSRSKRTGGFTVKQIGNLNDVMHVKRDVGKTGDDARKSEDEVNEGDSPVSTDEDLPLLSKRDQIPMDNDDDEFDKLIEKTNKNEKVRRDISEQSESKHIELGSLGSMNMGSQIIKSTSKRNDIVFKTVQERMKNTAKKISKREDVEVERGIDHLTSPPVQDGRVVLAFDEVKELLPTKRFFIKDSDYLLQPVTDFRQATFGSKVANSIIDVDKELADSMVLTEDNKRSKVLGLKATNVVYENNDDIADGKSKLKDAPLLTQKDLKLKKAQLRSQSDETLQKQEEMRNWVNSNKDGEEIDTNKKIQEVSDQLAESTAELEKLKSLNKAEEESAYLAKKLEEKKVTSNDSVEARENKFHQLQEQILVEQVLYKKLLEQQHKQYRRKIQNERVTLGEKQGNNFSTAASEFVGLTNKTSDQFDFLFIDSSSDVAPTLLTTPGNSLTRQSPFQATVKSPELEEIHFEKFGDEGQTNQDTKSAMQETLEEFERSHPSLSNETFPDDVDLESIDSKNVTQQEGRVPKVRGQRVDQNSNKYRKLLNETTSKVLSMSNTLQQQKNETKQLDLKNATITDKIQTALRSTTKPLTPVATTTRTPATTILTTTKTTSKATVTTPSTTMSTKVFTHKNTTVSSIVPTLPTIVHPENATNSNETHRTPQNNSLVSIQPAIGMKSNNVLEKTNNVSNDLKLDSEKEIHRADNTRINTSNIDKNISFYPTLKSLPPQSLFVLSSASGAPVTSTNISNIRSAAKEEQQDAYSESHLVVLVNTTKTTTKEMVKSQSINHNSNQTNEKESLETQENNIPLNLTKEKLPFPLEIAYRPRVLANTTKKKLEIEPRADGYVGCFFDHLVRGRDLPIRAGLPLVTPQICRSACKKSGYKYAGLQYGYLCFCGNNYGKYDIVPDAECNMACSGNDSFTCGALWKNEIFDTEHVQDTYDGQVEYYMPPKSRMSMSENPGSVRSNIPAPQEDELNEKVKENIQLLDQIHYSEQEDIQALEAIKANAIKRNTIGAVRNVGNHSDDDLMKAVSLEMKMNKALQKDINGLNHSPDLNPSPSSTTETNDFNNNKDEEKQAFSYLHPQNFEIDKPQHSPTLALKMEPGTHLFRGEIMLQQSWYDDLAKPKSTKYEILTGNIEIALKNIFANDSSFLKAEVMSLREDVTRTPHKTVADFTLTFLKNESTNAVTHKLIEAIMSKKKLDEMPAVPSSLRIKEYLHDSNAQAFIPRLINNKLQLEASYDTGLSFRKQSSPSISLNAAFQNLLPSEKRNDLATNQITYSRLNSAGQTSTESEGMKDLSSYMREQKFSIHPTKVLPKLSIENDQLRQLQQQNQQQQGDGKKRKVPYVLRMFFWKDMLARKKRENQLSTDSTAGELEQLKNQIKNKDKVIHFANGLPSIIRERRSQADEWPTTYKKDDEKKQYGSQALKRKRRYKDDNNDDVVGNNDNDFDALFNTLGNTKERVEYSKNRRDIPRKDIINKSLIIDES